MRSTRRLLIITPKLPPQIGGAASYYDELIKQRGATKVIVLTTRNKAAKVPAIEGVTIYRNIPNFVTAFWPVRQIVMPALTFAWASWITVRHGITHIQAHASNAMVVGACFVSQLSRIPITYDVQDLMVPTWLIRSGFAPRYLVLGHAIANRLNCAGIPRDRITIIPHLPPPADLPRDLERRPKTICYAGNITLHDKGLDVLIRSFERLTGEIEGLKLWIVGSGPDRKAAVQMIRGYGIDASVEWFGSSSRQQTLARLATASILVVPGRSEGVPQVITEAMAAGTPVIATRVGAIPELIENEERGLLVEPGDVYGLTRAIRRMLTDEKLAVTCSENSRKFIKSVPDWSAVAKTIYDLSTQQR